MESNGSSHIPIDKKNLLEYQPRASQLITKVTWVPAQENVAPSLRTKTEDTKSLLAFAKVISDDDVVLSDISNHVMSVLRKAITIGMHIGERYISSSGADVLGKLNAARRLNDLQVVEFQGKTTTASAAAVFSMSAYVRSELTTYEVDKVSTVTMPDVETPEVQLSNHIKGIEGVLYHLAVHLATPGIVQTDIQMVKATLLYFEAVIRAIKLKEASLGHKEFFEDVSYQLVGTDFILKGFEPQSTIIIQVNEFNRLDFSQIVGNRLAKHQAMRLAQRLVCFDPAMKKNPFSVIGGFHAVRLGYGFPGTGKSMQIQATATLIETYCKQIGIPFIFHPIPTALVSTYQGGSAQRMELWMSIRSNTGAIIYMPIDDAEGLFRSRTMEGGSEGSRDIIKAFLTGSEGASAPRFGNSVMEFFTNLPEQIDAAVMSRVTDRFTIDGATAFEDFLDQDRLWLKPIEAIDPGFIGMEDPKGYAYFANQGQVASMAKLNMAIPTVTDERIRLALAAADKQHRRNEHAFFATFYKEVKSHYPAFTSRDIRNIQQAVSTRLTDFDLPGDWFEKPELFFKQTFDRRVEMLKDLMRSTMKGLTFADVRFEEVMCYLSTLANMANIDRERRITTRMEQVEIDMEAAQRLRNKKGV